MAHFSKDKGVTFGGFGVFGDVELAVSGTQISSRKPHAAGNRGGYKYPAFWRNS